MGKQHFPEKLNKQEANLFNLPKPTKEVFRRIRRNAICGL
jgi:hypothetical protein